MAKRGGGGGDSDLIKAVNDVNIVECRRLLVESKEEGKKGGEEDDGYVVDIHERDNNGWSPIIIASRRGHVEIAGLLLSKGANIHDKNIFGNTCFSYSLGSNHNRVLYHLRKWPTTMAIIMLQELALIYIIDSESVIDLHQYLGRPDDCSKSDKEEDYTKDTEGNVL
jgi:hypothetical protein